MVHGDKKRCTAFKTTVSSFGRKLTSGYRRWGVYVSGGALCASLYQGGTRSVKTLFSLSANTWYEGLLRVNGTPRFQVIA